MFILEIHPFEMNLKMKFLGYKKEVICPLNDSKAIESGATFLSESFVFGVGVSIILAENWRAHNKDKNRRNYVDDALEDLEAKNNEMEEKLEDSLKTYKITEERIQLLEQENTQLRQILDEILSVSLGLKKHTQYDQSVVMTLPGISNN
ncbi:unnamed protein product [Cunninghamella echinulata]